MSKITGHKMFRMFERSRMGVLTKRPETLPSKAPAPIAGVKTRIKQLAREKIEAQGGTFIKYNFKSNVCHYLDRHGNKKATSVYTGLEHRKR